MLEWLSARIKIRITVAIIALLVVGMFSSCEELGYKTRGKTADATVVSIEPANFGDQKHEPSLRVNYRYLNQDNLVDEHDVVPAEYPVHGQQHISVQYIPGRENSSRIAGNNAKQMIYVYLFFGAITIGLLWFGALWYEGVRTSPNRR